MTELTIVQKKIPFVLFCVGMITIYMIAEWLLFEYFIWDQNYKIYSMILSFSTFIPFSFIIFLRTRMLFWNRTAILALLPWINVVITILTLSR